jgi:hypothetical protein
VSRPTIRLANDLEAEILLGYVAELLDDDNDVATGFARVMLLRTYRQLTEALELAETGECDNCGHQYDTSSRNDRCGDCGLCGACCSSEPEHQPTQTLKPQYEY